MLRNDLGAASRSRARGIVIASLATINIAGMLGLGWLSAAMLISDGVMVVELAICAAPMVVLALITVGAFALRRRGKTGAAIALLAVAALPTLAVFGFLLYWGV